MTRTSFCLLGGGIKSGRGPCIDVAEYLHYAVSNRIVTSFSGEYILEEASCHGRGRCRLPGRTWRGLGPCMLAIFRL